MYSVPSFVYFWRSISADVAGFALVLALSSLSLSQQASAQDRQGCRPPASRPTNLETRPGYTEWIPAQQLAPFKAALPQIEHGPTNAAMRSPDTMWYDENSMIFAYQDSIETVVGVRANCVGRDVGERNSNNPDIARLKNFFGPDYRFMFPFRKAAGTDNTIGVRVFNFWAPPKKGGQVLPVRWWKLSERGRWRWVFPVGTMFGEVLYQVSPSGEWVVFEVRTRTRYRDGWGVDLFRPFRTAKSMANAIKQRRPDWQDSSNLTTVVGHLESSSSLVAHRLTSTAFGKVFPPINGALDRIPAIDDADLVKELLTRFPFVSMEGAIWKEGGGLETYAPGSLGEFSIVPRNYEMGMIPVNEISCNRCHSETGRRIGEFDSATVLYGEVWGEDRIFTWHMFDPNNRIFGTWDAVDGSRVVNPRLVSAGLLLNGEPTPAEPDYKTLPTAFVPAGSFAN